MKCLLSYARHGALVMFEHDSEFHWGIVMGYLIVKFCLRLAIISICFEVYTF